MLVTFGGSFFAVMITSDSFEDYLDGIKSFLTAFHKKVESAPEMLEQILDMSQTARKEGLLALEERLESVENSFLKKGIRLLVDGTEQDLLKNILEIDMMLSIGEDTSAIGQGMSLALITTLYGCVISNWICIPISRKLEKRRNQETDIMELIIEGVLSIQAGENPQLIKEKLGAYL